MKTGETHTTARFTAAETACPSSEAVVVCSRPILLHIVKRDDCQGKTGSEPRFRGRQGISGMAYAVLYTVCLFTVVIDKILFFVNKYRYQAGSSFRSTSCSRCLTESY